MKRRLSGILVPVLAAVVLVVGWGAPANATTQRIYATKNCDTYLARTKVKATFNASAASYGKGKFYVTVDVRWDRSTYAGWINSAHNKVSSGHYYVGAGKTLSIYRYDASAWNWGYAGYRRVWRAHIISKLMKERTGPDKTVLREDRYYSQAIFKETATDCVVFG